MQGLESIPVGVIAAIVASFVGAIAYYYKGQKDKALDAFIQGRSDLQNFLAKQLPLPIPETEQVTRAEIKQALKDAGIDAGEGRDTDADALLVFTDGQYLAPIAEDVSVASDAMAVTGWLPYQPEVFDCEDYTGLWWALTKLLNGTNSVAMVFDWSGGHAYNILVDADGNAHVVEPQTTGDVRVAEDAYPLEKGIIVF